MTFLPLGNSDHVVVSVSIDFPSKTMWNVPFHDIAYDYYCADLDDFCDDLLLLNFVSGLRLELMYISLIVNLNLKSLNLK